MNFLSRISILLALAVTAAPARSCLNEYMPSQVASSFYKFITQSYGAPTTKSQNTPTTMLDPEFGVTLLRIIDQPPQGNWAARENLLRTSVSRSNLTFQTKSDYAVALLHLGRTREAIGILQTLAMEHPREYRIFGNLGAAYELDGQLEPALANISRATELNAESHEGTEWLHIRILKAKIAFANDPDWFLTHSTLGYDFPPGNPPQLPSGLETSLHVHRVARAIIYQLNERLQFVCPPDPTVADLLFDSANLLAATARDPVTTADLYKASLKFGSLREPAIKARLAALADPANSSRSSRVFSAR